ncbi:FHA domain-containing protein [Bowmanella dokdonensis]|uniref:FHA domain-containing protein n=1 Tax=Bowmanella dokdonensis TaxID=751969 RepID=A0A939DNR7_9ALTE|nr:FHA domain-containing protein [Bowmanella dokdonensis]MBN7825171.1 FHA domain-containing protein [Bowmanella dokdonensis]
MAIVIEKLAANDKMVKHYLFDKPSVSVGRSYSNDICLDDPYVCPEHLHIEQDPHSGEIQIHDRDSVNGLLINGKPAKQAILKHSDVISLGKTRLRLFDSSQAVEPTLRLSPIESRLAVLSHWRFALLLAFIYALTLTYQAYQNTFVDFEIGQMLPRLLSEFLLLSAWPLLFGLLARLQKQEARLASQYSLIWLFALLTVGLSLTNQWFRFNFPQMPAWNLLELIVMGLVFFSLLWLSLLIAFHQSTARRNRIALGCSLIFVSLVMGWHQVKQADFSPRPVYRFLLMPDDYAVGQGVNSEAFIEQLHNSYDKAAKARDKD